MQRGSNRERIWRDLSEDDGGTDRGDRNQSGIATTKLKVQCLPGVVLAFARTTIEAYFFAGACGCDGGTVSISLPENTGAEVGWPLGEPPVCSTVTA